MANHARQCRSRFGRRRINSAVAFGATEVSRESFDDFDDVIDFTQVHREELGGEEAQDTWHLRWGFRCSGDLSLVVARDFDALASLAPSKGMSCSSAGFFVR